MALEPLDTWSNPVVFTHIPFRIFCTRLCLSVHFRTRWVWFCSHYIVNTFFLPHFPLSWHLSNPYRAITILAFLVQPCTHFFLFRPFPFCSMRLPLSPFLSLKFCLRIWPIMSLRDAHIPGARSLWRLNFSASSNIWESFSMKLAFHHHSVAWNLWVASRFFVEFIAAGL